MKKHITTLSRKKEKHFGHSIVGEPIRVEQAHEANARTARLNRDWQDAYPLWSFHHHWKRSIQEFSWWNSRNTIFWKCSLRNSLRRQHSSIGKRTPRQECVSCSNHPVEASPWMKEVEMANFSGRSMDVAIGFRTAISEFRNP